jgi:hypothetical protein
VTAFESPQPPGCKLIGNSFHKVVVLRTSEGALALVYALEEFSTIFSIVSESELPEKFVESTYKINL